MLKIIIDYDDVLNEKIQKYIENGGNSLFIGRIHHFLLF